MVERKVEKLIIYSLDYVTLLHYWNKHCCKEFSASAADFRRQDRICVGKYFSNSCSSKMESQLWFRQL